MIRKTTGMLLAFLLLACDDHISTEVVQYEHVDSQRISSSVEAGVLHELTRGVALALTDRGLRQRVKNDMRHSPFNEHKLDFSSYLRGHSGGILLAKMSSTTGQDRESILRSLELLPELSFYMPVRQHRETWTGGSNLLVAAQLHDRDEPIGYDLLGRYAILSLSQVPEVPTLVLVPSETDFSRPMKQGTFRNSNDAGGQAIGTYALCDPETSIDGCEGDGGGGGGGGGGGSGGGTTPSPAGLYLSFSEIYDQRESWPNGDPEIEFTLMGPTSSFNDLQPYGCAHEDASSSLRRFNQDGRYWYGTTDGGNDVLIADSADIQQLRAAYPDTVVGHHGMMIVAMEDDHERCVAHDDDDEYYRNLRYAFWHGLGVVTYLILHEWQPEDDWEAVLMVGTAYYSIKALLRTGNDDDFIGVAEGAESWNARNGDTVLRTHVLKNDETRKGTINLHARPKGYYW